MNQSNKAPADIDAGQEVEISRLTAEDAAGVVDLFHSVYGEGYPVRTYMDAGLLIKENAADRTISSVAKTSRGEIVGHTALFNSAPHKGIYESGAGVVHAAYRGGKGIFTQMVAHCLATAKTMPNIEAVFGEPVCNHTFSQKMSLKLSFVSRALEVDLMPAAAYAKEASASGRVAAFLDFKTIRPKPHTLYFPASYSEDLRFFYENFDDDRDFRLSEDPIPAGTSTDLRPEVFAFAAVARVAVHGIGTDFSTHMDELEKSLERQGVLVQQLWLQLACPWVGAATEVLRRRGYFIGGALPLWFGTDGLLMQKINKRPDWDGICTASEHYAGILARVRADWQRTQG